VLARHAPPGYAAIHVLQLLSLFGFRACLIDILALFKAIASCFS
jgi:hypothetical protein